MADSAREIAAKAVAIACSTTTNFVKIISLDPLDVIPKGLFDLTFKQIGLFDDAQMEAFRSTLIHILPDNLSDNLIQMPLSTGILTGLVLNHVEALLLNS